MAGGVVPERVRAAVEVVAAGPEPAVLRRALAPGGVLHVLYDGGAPAGAERTLDAVLSWLPPTEWTTTAVRGTVIGMSARPR